MRQLINKIFKIIVVLMMALLGLLPDTVSALATSSNNTSTTITSTTNSQSNVNKQNQTQVLSNIISKGNQEISRRLKNLTNLASLIDSATKLTASDKTTLLGEVSSTITGLNSLKTTLDNATNISQAVSDVQSIVSEYRVYVLVYPKIHLIKVADDQQAIELKLTTLASKLASRFTNHSSVNNLVTLKTDLSDMNSQISTAQAISSSVESTVITLQPTDYNANHTVLEGYNSQLQTARSDIISAISYAKTIILSLQASNSTNSAK
jgi:hypothetical protein